MRPAPFRGAWRWPAPARASPTLRTFDDALAIRERLRGNCRVAIIGGGFIGLELAASARRLGAEVTVIEAQPRILMRGVPAEIAAVVHDLHRGKGVEIACGEQIAAIEDETRGIRIRLAGGRAVEADLAVIGIGAVPVTALAEGAGLAVDNGIAVDDRLRAGRSRHFRRRRLLLVPAVGLRRASRAARGLAQRSGAGDAGREKHARRRRKPRGGALVLVGSA